MLLLLGRIHPLETHGILADADRGLAKAEKQLRYSAKRARAPQLRRRLERSANSLAVKRRKVQAAQAAPPSQRPAKSRASSLELNDWAESSAGF